MKIVDNIRKNTFIILIITMLVMYFVLKDDFRNIFDLLLKIDLKYIFIAFFLFLLSIFLRAYVSYKTVDNKSKYSLIESFKHNLIVQFFNGITPFSTGGQPMEIYMLTEHEISASKGTMIILQNFIFYQVSLVLFGIGAVTYNHFFHIFPNQSLLKQLVLIGFIVNTLVAIGIFLVSISRKFTGFCVNLLIKFFAKIRIVKNKDKTITAWKNRLDEFHECAKYLRKKKSLFFLGVFFNLLSLTSLYIIPLFIAYSMGEYTSLNILNTLTSSAYVLLIGAFVPIPGASGGIEYGFIRFFCNFLNSSLTSAVLLIWRFITYYFGMIIGMILFNIDERGKKR